MFWVVIERNAEYKIFSRFHVKNSRSFSNFILVSGSSIFTLFTLHLEWILLNILERISLFKLDRFFFVLSVRISGSHERNMSRNVIKPKHYRINNKHAIQIFFTTSFWVESSRLFANKPQGEQPNEKNPLSSWERERKCIGMLCRVFHQMYFILLFVAFERISIFFMFCLMSNRKENCECFYDANMCALFISFRISIRVYAENCRIFELKSSVRIRAS